MNFIGVLCAAATFLGVWFGHVSVRCIEANAVSIRWPAVLFAGGGVTLLAGALLVSSVPLSAVMGILGITTLWDALELFRQQARVIKGHAPANPRNSRHSRILAEHASASTIAWLKREPQGRPLSQAEIDSIREAGL